MPRAKKQSAVPSRGPKKTAAAKGSKAKAGSDAIAVAKDTFEVPTDASISTAPPIAQNQASQPLMLPDCLDSAAAITIKDMLLTQRGNAIAVDASQVRRVGVQSLQVLVAAARSWQRDGLSYRLENPSSEFLETIALVGLPHQELLLEGHQ
jgi:anti-anti-sigma regulatory factor